MKKVLSILAVLAIFAAVSCGTPKEKNCDQTPCDSTQVDSLVTPVTADSVEVVK